MWRNPADDAKKWSHLTLTDTIAMLCYVANRHDAATIANIPMRNNSIQMMWFVSMEMVAIMDVMTLTKVCTIIALYETNFNATSSNAVKHARK